MKAIVICNNYPTIENSLPVSWYIVADSAVSNTGKPFYLPEEDKISVSASFAVKFSRLGKSIENRFASRYFQEIAPALHFRNESLLKKLQREGLPWSPALSFDKSVMIGDWLTKGEDFEVSTIELRNNGEKMVSFKIEDMKMGMDEVIREFSLTNTIKMGDVMLPFLSHGIDLKEGDYLEVLFNGRRAFIVKIR